MKITIVCVLALSLSGCASFEDTLASAGFSDGDADAVVEPAPVVAQAAPVDDWCARIAAADVAEAARGGLDVPTQRRIASRSFAQCMALSGLGTGR